MFDLDFCDVIYRKQKKNLFTRATELTDWMQIIERVQFQTAVAGYWYLKDINLRSGNNLPLMRWRIKLYKNSLYPDALTRWNKLDPSIRQVMSLKITQIKYPSFVFLRKVFSIFMTIKV